MFVQMRTIVVKKGFADQVVEGFSGEKPMDQMDGLIDRTVMTDTRNREQDEVVVMIRWESKEAWKNWEKSDAHIQGHRAKKGQQPPEHIISTKVAMYEVAATKVGKAAAAAQS